MEDERSCCISINNLYIEGLPSLPTLYTCNINSKEPVVIGYGKNPIQSCLYPKSESCKRIQETHQASPLQELGRRDHSLEEQEIWNQGADSFESLPQ